LIHLRPYQSSILDEVRAIIRDSNGVPSIMVVSPTGSGKTAMFAEIAVGAARKNNRVLILVHRREIMEQTLKAISSAETRTTTGTGGAGHS